jgi:hypothetical protein
MFGHYLHFFSVSYCMQWHKLQVCTKSFVLLLGTMLAIDVWFLARELCSSPYTY